MPLSVLLCAPADEFMLMVTFLVDNGFVYCGAAHTGSFDTFRWRALPQTSKPMFAFRNTSGSDCDDGAYLEVGYLSLDGSYCYTEVRSLIDANRILADFVAPTPAVDLRG